MVRCSKRSVVRTRMPMTPHFAAGDRRGGGLVGLGLWCYSNVIRVSSTRLLSRFSTDFLGHPRRNTATATRAAFASGLSAAAAAAAVLLSMLLSMSSEAAAASTTTTTRSTTTLTRALMKSRLALAFRKPLLARRPASFVVLLACVSVCVLQGRGGCCVALLYYRVDSLLVLYTMSFTFL